MKAHLLYQDEDFDFSAELPARSDDVIQDLELTTVLQAMGQGDRFLFGVARRVVLASLTDSQAIRYRQNVLGDCLTHPDLAREIYDIAVGALEDKRHLWGLSTRFPSGILAAAVSQIEVFVARLRQLRAVADEHLGTFGSTGMRQFCRTLQCELDDDYFKLIDEHLKRLKFSQGELISMELDRDNSGINYVLRSPTGAKPSLRQRLGLGPRTSLGFSVHPRDDAGLDALSEMTGRALNLVANAAAQSADHIASYFTMLCGEMGFYVGCLNLHEQLSARGQRACFPDPVRGVHEVLSFRTLRDASLTLRSTSTVVGNDATADGKNLVIVTGANSGGKSTWLRSVGLAQLMMQSGLFVVAEAFRSSPASIVLTHFIREEDASMTSGRLDEELNRMSAIADVIRPGALVLFNESFAGTNEREGSEIGRQIVRALLDAHIRVLFVTHQYDFAESFYLGAKTTTLFLRAPRQTDGSRTFKLEMAEPLPTSFGEDLYWRVGSWLEEDHHPTSAGVR